ncbi:MAG TPA: Lrp/AsnC family transcriptional regulator [Blastocatellia bacterium]|jgi:Lrp/AsnC family leucine-responsive transcriptional regulator|nr:Lrp/AsnC family transcriptional regulator [Blastocatellia bacterium]
MIDDVDLKLLSIIQEDARTPVDEISCRTGIEPSVVGARIEELERRGVIRGYHARLSPEAVGLGLTAFIFVRTDWHSDVRDTAEHLARIPEALEVHRIAGEDCYLVKVQASGIEELGRLIREKFDCIESVSSTETTVVLKTVKEGNALPLKKPAPLLAIV